MSLILDFNFGRLLQNGETLTNARLNAIVRGISATLSGTIGTDQFTPGSVNETIVAPGPYFYTEDCTLTGSAYTVLNFPVDPTALAPGMILMFKADADCPANPRLTVGALGTSSITKYGGQDLAAGDILADQIVCVQYTVGLLAQPTWAMVSLPANRTTPAEQPVTGTSRGLTIKNNAGTPTGKVDVTADEVTLKDAAGIAHLSSAVNLTINMAVNGANGLDTGGVAASTWYYIWLIFNPTSATLAGLFSLSATAPTLPAGYTYQALFGAVRSNGASNLVTFHQIDSDVFLNQTNIFTAKQVAVDDTYELYSAGAGGGDVDLRTVIPPTARKVRGTIGNSVAGNNQSMAIAADANGLGAILNVAAAVGGGNMVDGFASASSFEIPLKTAQTVYWKSTAPQARNRMSVSGYSF